MRASSLAANHPLTTLTEEPSRDRRLGKRLYFLIAIIVALATIAIALLVTQGGAIVIELGQTTDWSQTYHGDSGRAIQTSDGGYAIAGTNASVLFFPASERAPILIKTDASGKLIWNRTFEATGLVAVIAVMQTQDGGYALSGTNIAPPILSPVYSGWLIKTDGQGIVQWTKTFGLPLQTCYAIQDHSGNYVVLGYATNERNGDDMVLYKVNPQGTLIWTKILGENASKLFGTRLLEASDSGYIVAGALDHDGWLAKTDIDGNLQWSKTYSSSTGSTLPLLSADKAHDGGYILCGGNIANSWLIKTDSNGNQQWIKTLETNTLLHSVREITGGGYIAVGSRDHQAYVVMTDALGNLLSAASYGDKSGNISSYAGSVIVTNNGFVVSGSLNHYVPTSAEGFKVTPFVGNNVWLAKIPLDLSPKPTS